MVGFPQCLAIYTCFGDVFGHHLLPYILFSYLLPSTCLTFTYLALTLAWPLVLGFVSIPMFLVGRTLSRSLNLGRNWWWWKRARSTFTMERGVTRVNINLCSTINVKHMRSRVFMGKMFGQPLKARLIKWKLGLLWRNEVKNIFYLDHFGRRWFAMEFTDEEDFNPSMLGVKYSIWKGGPLALRIWTSLPSLSSWCASCNVFRD